MREKLETLSLTTLKDLAKQEGIKGISGLRKAEIIDLLCEQEDMKITDCARMGRKVCLQSVGCRSRKGVMKV